LDFGATPFDGLLLPTSVTICEVGPRDGLQNESTVLPADVERLVDAGAAQAREAGVQVRGYLPMCFGDPWEGKVSVLRVSGITTFDTSAGGLGGCPYAKSGTGNLATEDLLWQLHGLGIVTGIDLQKMVDTSVWLARQLGRPSPSRTVTALAG
jgi:hydroxymethylglutaryl-CoA lyase